MTIPIQPVQIGSTGVVPPGPNFLEIVLGAIQKRQELDQAREDLKRKREQFELNAKLAGAQIQGMELDNEKKKRDFKDQELDLTARDEALRLYTGSLPDLHNPQGIGRVIAGIKDPRVAAHFYSLLQQGAQATNAATPDYQFRDAGTPQGGSEIVGFDPQNPTHPVSTGRPSPPATESRRIPVVTEREKASAAVGAAQANAVINQLETADPGIAARVARRVAAYRAGLSAVGKRLLGASPEEIALAAESQIEQSMSPEELQFYQASKQWLGAVLPGLSGKQVTAREYVMQAPAYFSMGGANPQVAANRRKARATRTRGFMAEAGDAMAERAAEIPQPEEYGLGSVTLPDSTVHQITPGKARYHPRFRTSP